jgi:hypothetical protein
MRAITVRRTFEDFEDYWATVQGGPSVGAKLRAMTPESRSALAARMRERLVAGAGGRITYAGRANAVKGRVRE